MDKIYNRNVDVFTLDIKYPEGATVTPSFKELLLDPILSEGDLKIKGKALSFKVLEQKDDYIVGLVETNRNDNIPPLKRRAQQKIEAMDLPEGDGLAFGNVFYFDIKRNVILYEVNKNGSILNHFVEFIYRKLKHLRRYYSVNSYPVLTADQNAKLQKMTVKTKIELEVSHPKSIAANQVDKKGSFFYLFNQGANLDSTKLKVEFSANAMHGLSLNSKEAIQTIKEIQDQIKLEHAEIEHLKIYGYIDNGFDDKLQTIDLVTERLKGTIELREPRLASNLLEIQRQGQIKLLYEKIEGDLISIFGK